MADTTQTESQNRIPTSVELGDLPTQPTSEEQQSLAGATRSGDMAAQQEASAADMSETRLNEPSQPSITAESADAGSAPPLTMPPAAVTRRDTEAIGPSTDLPTNLISPATAQGAVIQFTLLLASTGTRHPYQLNERYLSKRNVQAQNDQGDFDPSVISVYTLKELILKDWRDDWDAKPSSPSAIRLISFGQLLADNSSLKDCKLNLHGTPNVIHVTVKPQEAMEDEDAGGKGKSSMHRGRDGSDRTPGCRCVIL